MASKPSAKAPKSMQDVVDQLHLSPKEVQNLNGKMGDPEFTKLFNAYLKERQDPKNREEQEQWYRQLDATSSLESHIGEGKVLIIPTPERVIKARLVPGGATFFVNLCSSAKIKEAQLLKEPPMRWLCPMICSSPRDGTDGRGERCQIMECVVHPTAVSLASSPQSAQFQAELFTSIKTALETSTLGLRVDHRMKFISRKFKGSPGQEAPNSFTAKRDEHQDRLRPAEFPQKSSGSAYRPNPPVPLAAQNALIQELSSFQQGGSTPAASKSAGASSAARSRPAASGSQALHGPDASSPSVPSTSDVPASNGRASACGLPGRKVSSSEGRPGSSHNSQLSSTNPKQGSTISQEAAGPQGKTDTPQPSTRSRGFSFAFGTKKQPSAARSESRQPLQALQNGSPAGIQHDKAASLTTATPGQEPDAASTPQIAEVTPRHEILEQSNTDLANAWSDPHIALQQSTLPQEVVVRAWLPGAQARDVDLAINHRSLTLKVPEMYHLHLPLRYQVDPLGGRAKFDKTTGKIEVSVRVIRMPSRPSSASSQPNVLPASMSSQDLLLPTTPAPGHNHPSAPPSPMIQELPATSPSSLPQHSPAEAHQAAASPSAAARQSAPAIAAGSADGDMYASHAANGPHQPPAGSSILSEQLSEPTAPAPANQGPSKSSQTEGQAQLASDTSSRQAESPLLENERKWRALHAVADAQLQGSRHDKVSGPRRVAKHVTDQQATAAAEAMEALSCSPQKSPTSWSSPQSTALPTASAIHSQQTIVHDSTAAPKSSFGIFLAPQKPGLQMPMFTSPLMHELD
ncbi:hypothetical protein WJX74_010255 [Apatococcus lobatus]|uniref:PIH1 domain-containing protein 1 n=1 Tax=Apatococcus lobatus TaxID=904363 RepID=A0AAW1SA48_9CHLO